MSIHLWMLPGLLHDKLIANPALGHYFKKIPHHCYNDMMVSILMKISTHEPISIETKLMLQRAHHSYHITKDEYDEFVRLFVEVAASIGECPTHYAYVFRNELDPLFNFKDDDFREEIRKRLQVVAMMLEAEEDAPLNTYDETRKKVEEAIASIGSR